MITVTLVKWGNSVGIRLPAAILKKAHLNPGEQLEIIINKKGNVSLIPIKNPQEGWTEAFNAIASTDETLIDVPNEFDKDE